MKKIYPVRQKISTIEGYGSVFKNPLKYPNNASAENQHTNDNNRNNCILSIRSNEFPVLRIRKKIK
jgi:hypothetical protein